MDLVIVTSGVLLHVALGRWVSSPWMVPDLTLVGLVMALVRFHSSGSRVVSVLRLTFVRSGLSRAESRDGVEPMRAVVITSLLAMAFTVHHPFQAAGAYLVVGWGIKALMSRLEATRGFLPLITIGVAEALLLVILGSPLIVGGMRWVVTCGCSLPVIQLMHRRLV